MRHVAELIHAHRENQQDIRGRCNGVDSEPEIV
jgi:hypothetical protein